METKNNYNKNKSEIKKPYLSLNKNLKRKQILDNISL